MCRCLSVCVMVRVRVRVTVCKRERKGLGLGLGLGSEFFSFGSDGAEAFEFPATLVNPKFIYCCSNVHKPFFFQLQKYSFISHFI